MLDKLPKGVQARSKHQLQEIWLVERAKAEGRALEHFVAAYQAKYDKAVECRLKDR